MTWLWDVSTVTGALSVVLSILGVLGLAALLMRRDRPWWRVRLPITLGVALVVTAAADLVVEVWRPFPESLPVRVLTSPRCGWSAGGLTIDGTRSGFHARQAMVYLPPAYLGSVRPELPVLVMIPGQPGGPEDWFVAGKMASIMDGFAAAHAGVAPIVVVPDATGSTLANTLCLDSQLGNVETYLAEDVPAWLAQHLQVDPDRARWAIGGFSFGGTCALQLALRRPAVYPTFLDISGRPEPTLGDHASTVQAAFGGDEERFRAVNPLDILAAGQFPGDGRVRRHRTRRSRRAHRHPGPARRGPPRRDGAPDGAAARRPHLGDRHHRAAARASLARVPWRSRSVRGLQAPAGAVERRHG